MALLHGVRLPARPLRRDSPAGCAGSVRGFTFLRTDPRFFYKTGAELLDALLHAALLEEAVLVLQRRTLRADAELDAGQVLALDAPPSPAQGDGLDDPGVVLRGPDAQPALLGPLVGSLAAGYAGLTLTPGPGTGHTFEVVLEPNPIPSDSSSDG